METIDRKQFTLSNGPNGFGTFYTFRNEGIDEIGFEYIRPLGDVKDLHVLTFDKVAAQFENPKFYSLEQFVEEFAHKGGKITLYPGWDVELALGIKNAKGKFVGLSDNVHLNFPGMGGNATHKIEYAKIKSFNILFAYTTHRVELAM